MRPALLGVASTAGVKVRPWSNGIERITLWGGPVFIPWRDAVIRAGVLRCVVEGRGGAKISVNRSLRGIGTFARLALQRVPVAAGANADGWLKANLNEDLERLRRSGLEDGEPGPYVPLPGGGSLRA